jgi:hypothetical protein
MKLVAFAVLAACTRGGDPPRSMQGPMTSTPQDSTMATLRWRPQPIATLGLTVDVVDGTAIDERDAGAVHALQQFHPRFQIGAWLGKDASLAWWRNRFLPAAKVGPETPLQVCGRPAHRQEVSAPADSATGSFPTASGVQERTTRTPARVHVAIAGTTAAGLGFVVSWVVDADQRDTMRADEDHFIASITCS